MNGWLWTALSAAGALGMAVCLYGMYGDKRRGFPALQALDGQFSSLDMRWRYTPEAVFACFDGVGAEGQRLLCRLWKLDYVFIIFFLMVMLAVTHNVAGAAWVAAAMTVAAGLRALLDMLENALLLKVCAAYPARRDEKTAGAAAVVTSLKWLVMALWLTGLFGSLMVKAVQMAH